MNDEIPTPTTQTTTTQTTKETSAPTPPDDSRVFGVSVRAWLVLMVCGTVCAGYLTTLVMAYLQGELIIEIKEPLYSIAVGAVAYYFGQSKNKTS